MNVTMAEPIFWPTFLWAATGEDLDAFAEAFAVTEEDLLAFYRARLADPREWPVIRIPLHSGQEIRVVFRNFVEDEGIDYLLVTPHCADELPLANLEGCFRGPGLAWQELTAVAAMRVPGDRLSPTARFLLLLPIMSDADAPPEAGGVVESALGSFGATGDLDGLFLEGMSSPVHWHYAADGALICDGEYSLRNPRDPHAFSREEARVITDALREREGR